MRGRIKAEYTITLSGDCILIGCTGIVDGNCGLIGYRAIFWILGVNNKK